MNLLKKLQDPKFLVRLPSAVRYKINRIFHEKILFRFASKEGVFTSIWRNNYWGSGESLSGPGATLEQTENLRKQMPVMFSRMGIWSVFDAPCGDMNWMQHVLEDANFTYLGGDIVGKIISVNQRRFANAKVGFVKFDMTADMFPTADVWLCRAVLYHLSNQDVYLALEQFAASNIKYILTTNCPTSEDHINVDIRTGDWRPLNLMLPPFNFPRESLWEIDDYVEPHPPVTLVLWSREQIQSILPALRETYRQ